MQKSRGAPDIPKATTKIGFVGLGRMGGNLAARFLAAGYTVYGEVRSREHAENLVQEGLLWSETPREVAEGADIVFTSLPDDVLKARAPLLLDLPEDAWFDIELMHKDIRLALAMGDAPQR